jgi:pimeloyl-ACP methyl ester carboxylesterase
LRARRSFAGQLLARAAAGLDRAVTLAVRVAKPISDDEPSHGSGHEARVQALESVEARLASEDLATFFPEPREIEPSARQRGAFNARLSRTDLAWDSIRDTFLPELEERFRTTHENRVAVARLVTRPEPRPIAVLVHGYLLGQLAVDERVWPIAALDGLGFDSALYVMPFHGRRADPGRGGRPEFPGRNPAFAAEGFRQAVTELRELMRCLRRRGHPRVGLLGMSLGGYTAALTATVDADVDFLAPIVPLASLADFALEHGELAEAPEPRALEHALLARVYRHVSPVDRPPLIAPERVLVIGARADRITRFSHARRLASHFRSPLVAFHGGHLLQLGRGEAFERLGELLRSIV